jgi:NADH:ubiquinone oxidoreductase subunit 6 (subunit J)
MTAFMFYVLSALVLASAAYVVTSRNLFHAGIGLISCFMGVAGIYITLSAPFMGAMQVLIYAGAIAVVLLFGFMLTHDLMHPTVESFQPMAGALTAISIGFVLTLTAVAGSWARPSDHAEPLGSGIKILADNYMKDFAVPFEMVALLLLISLVGAIVIARKEESPE